MCTCLGHNHSLSLLRSGSVDLSLGFGSASLLCLGSGIADTFKMSLLIAELTNGVHGDTFMAAVFVTATKTFETRGTIMLFLHDIALE